MAVPAAPLFDLQTLAFHDGPGIRTIAFLKGCPLRCAWCCNPEGQSAQPELRWHRARCRGCVPCQRPFAQRCPGGALELVGRTIDADELCALVRRDLRLYWNTGGGLTFSGGEPLLHPDFVGEVAGRLAELGVGTVVETAGAWCLEEVAAAVERCQLVFFDLKGLDAAAHLALTGAELAPLLANLERLAGRFPGKVRVSLPLIPGLLDSLTAIAEAGRTVQRLGVRQVRLLPHHRLGEGKYESLGRALPCLPGELPASLPTEAAALLGGLGIEVSIER